MNLCPDFVDLTLDLDETSGYWSYVYSLGDFTAPSSRTQVRTSHETDSNGLSQMNRLVL